MGVHDPAGALMRRPELENGSKSAATDAAQPEAGAGVPTSLRDPAAPGFWIAVALTGLSAGLGAAL